MRDGSQCRTGLWAKIAADESARRRAGLETSSVCRAEGQGVEAAHGALLELSQILLLVEEEGANRSPTRRAQAMNVDIADATAQAFSQRRSRETSPEAGHNEWPH